MSTSERHDVPDALLRTCVLILGPGKPEWSRAMLVELRQVDGHRSRWAFALGCIRCLAFTMPASASQKAIRVGAFVAAIGSLLVVAAAFLRYPGVVSGAQTWVLTVFFAAFLLAYMLAAVGFGARVVDSRLIVTSALAGAVIAASWLAIGLDTGLGGLTALTVALLCLGPLVALGLGWRTTTRSGSGRVSMAVIGLTALIAGFAVFLLWSGWTVAAAGRPYDAGQLRDFTTSGFADLATYAVNDSLGTGMVLLLVVPLLAALSGLAGAAVARIERLRSISNFLFTRRT